MNKLVLVEGNHVIRLGLYKLLSELPNGCAIISLDIKGIEKMVDVDWRADLVVLGLPCDPCEGLEALATVEEFLRPERTILLSEPFAPWRPIAGVPNTSIYACLEKNAPTQALMAAVQMGMKSGKDHLETSHAAPPGRPWPQRLSTGDHISTRDSFPSGPSIGQDRGQPCAINDVRAPERLAGTLAATSAPALTDHGGTSVRGAELLHITPRQYEVLQLLACGHPVKTVARIMDISVATAKAHTAALYRQLNVNSRGEAVYTAHQLGALPH